MCKTRGMKRYELTKEQWKRVKLLLPPEGAGKRGCPRKDSRTMLNGMLWSARIGAQWQDCPKPTAHGSQCISDSPNGAG